MQSLRNPSHLLTLFAVVLIGALGAGPVLGVPINGAFSPDPSNCDNPGPINLTHELGPLPLFPLNEALIVNVTQVTTPQHFGCSGDDGIANEYEVRITNVSGIAWQDLYFVADEGVPFSNFDGFADDLAFPGPSQALAFRIDGTVTPGINNPLGVETLLVDEILQPGESWSFAIDNWNGFLPPIFESVGKFADSSGVGLDTLSTASILANPVPEPASVALLVIGGAAALRRQTR